MSLDLANEKFGYDQPYRFLSSEIPNDGETEGFSKPQRRSNLPTKRLVIVRPAAKKKSGWLERVQEEDIRPVVHGLVDQIRKKYLQSSNLDRLIFSQEYMAIIGLGPRVVPILLDDMQRGVIPWFWALKALTRQDIGADVRAGDFRALRDAWLSWGKLNRLI